MAQHIGRKELRRDEIRETLVHGAEAALSHQGALWMTAGTALAVLLLVFGWRFYSERQTVKATTALEEAQKVFQARIRAMGEPEQPGETTYVDEKNRHEDAARKFAEVAQKFPRSQAGEKARYYAGLANERLGKSEEAVKWFVEAENGGDAELASLGRLGRARILAKTGKGEEAVKLYQQLLANPTTMASQPLILLTLGDYYRRDKPQEAEKLYQQVRKEFPDTEMARMAQERLESLPPKT